ncbi:MAG TPA: hypothetical protein VLE53_15130 [Gemmatimonadaceae bacterium]|nr:hypothetical protein [Gemmatimonadaceae bacterium]
MTLPSQAISRPRPAAAKKAAAKKSSVHMLEERLRKLPAPVIADALQSEGLVIDAVSEQRIRAHVPPAGGTLRRRVSDWLRAGEIVVERRPSRLHTSAVPDLGRMAGIGAVIGFAIATLVGGPPMAWLLQGLLLSVVAVILLYAWSATTVPSPVLRALGSLWEDELAGVKRRAR